MQEPSQTYEDVVGEVVNESKQLIPVKEKSQSKNKFEIEALLNTAGKVLLTDEQKEVLFAPIDEESIEIRPDGLIYAPWMEYATRLREAFGMEWALIPNGMPDYNRQNNAMYWGFWLIIQGHLCGFAIGEQQYFANNRTMTYTDACEGAKSNALMRLCKGIGISLELWKPSFVRQWKSQYAETYQKQGKTLWKKKGQDTPQETPQDEPKAPPKASPNKPMSEPQRKKIYAMMKAKELTNAQCKDMMDWIKKNYPDPDNLTSADASEMIEHFEELFSEWNERRAKD